MTGPILALALIAVFVAAMLALAHRSNRQEEARQARARLIYAARADESYFDHPTYASAVPPVEKPLALSGAPAVDIDWQNDDHVEHHAAEGVAAAQFMLDRLWTQKGHDR